MAVWNEEIVVDVVIVFFLFVFLTSATVQRLTGLFLFPLLVGVDFVVEMMLGKEGS